MSDSQNLKDDEKDDLMEELSEYFSVFGNESRLKILKTIQKGAKDARTIANTLNKKWNIEVSVPNTKKHLKKLIEIGVVTKYPVIREDGQIVMFYRCVSSSLDAVLKNLHRLSGIALKEDTINIEGASKIEKTIEEILNEFPLKSKLVLLDGKNITGEYPLEKNCMSIGRMSPKENDISLPDTDRTVGRKQSRIIYESGRYYLEDIGSKNGTYLMDKNQKQFVKLELGKRVGLNDGDIMRLGFLNTILVFRRARLQ